MLAKVLLRTLRPSWLASWDDPRHLHQQGGRPSTVLHRDVSVPLYPRGVLGQLLACSKNQSGEPGLFREWRQRTPLTCCMPPQESQISNYVSIMERYLK